MVKLLAPNGSSSYLTLKQYKLVRTPEFKTWFGDWENDPANASKVVDENGEPMVVYHGTSAEPFDIFYEGSYFTDDYMNADGYASGEMIYEVFLNMKKPLIINARGRKWNDLKNKYGSSTQEIVSKLDDEKYDGIFFNNINDNWFDDEGEPQNVYYTINPEQIKLADGTNTTFDSNNPDIRYTKGGKLNKGGDCYYMAGQLILNNEFLENKIDYIGTPYLVHAEVQGQGAISNLRYGHAWIEDDVFVYDYSNNRKIVLPKDFYYRIGDIKTNNPKKYRKYNFEQAKIKMLETKNYGCWDLEVEYKNGGEIIINPIEIECHKCHWHWKVKDGGDDLFICHKCYYDNTKFYKFEGLEGQKILDTISYDKGGQILNLNKIRKGQYEAKFNEIEIYLTNPKILNGFGTNKWQLVIIYGNDSVAKEWFDTKNEALKTGAIFLNDFLNSNYKKGGRTISQTPAPKKDQIKGSDKNKEGSAKDLTSAKKIKFADDVLEKIQNSVDKHNKKHSNKKITIDSAKAVVRRGMGAYSSTHRPTISGGNENSRVAWGLARLNAFIYKIINGKSKSGKYSQDDDLINELGYKVAKYVDGGYLNNFVLYHGTGNANKVIQALKDGSFIFHKSAGVENGIYLTSNKKIAFDYANDTQGEDIGVLEIRFNEIPNFKTYNNAGEQYYDERKYSSNPKEASIEYKKDLIKNNYDGYSMGEVYLLLKEKIDLIDINKTSLVNNYSDGGLIAPNGKPSNLTPEQYKLVRTPAFKKYEIGGIFQGTPYDFNAYSTEYIGTGEGNQVFGWGLYFTDVKDIAKNYAKNQMLIQKEISRKSDNSAHLWIYTNISDNVVDKLGYLKIKLKEFEELKKEYKKDTWDDKIEAYSTLIDIIQNYQGKIYSVTLFKGEKETDYHLIKWENPLIVDDLVKIFDEAEKIGGIEFKNGWELDEIYGLTNERGNKITGEEMYRWLSKQLGGDKEASLFLLRAGIDGIKYKAGTLSGMSDKEGYNYVIFDANDITIEGKEKYNEILAGKEKFADGGDIQAYEEAMGISYAEGGEAKPKKVYVSIRLDNTSKKIPNTFMEYFNVYSEKPFEELKNGKLEGLVGVSSSPNNIAEWFIHRDCLIVMDYKEFIAINETEIINYYDPYQLMKNNLYLFKRLYANVGARSSNEEGSYVFKQTLVKILEKIVREINLEMNLAEGQKYSELYRISRFLSPYETSAFPDWIEENKIKIESPIDLTNAILDFNKLNVNASYLGYGFENSVLTFDELLPVIEKGVTNASSIYDSEQEIVLNNRELNIPKNSQLFFIGKDEVGRERKNNRNELIEKYNLKELYKVYFVDAQQIQKYRDFWVKKEEEKFNKKLEKGREDLELKKEQVLNELLNYFLEKSITYVKNELEKEYLEYSESFDYYDETDDDSIEQNLFSIPLVESIMNTYVLIVKNFWKAFIQKKQVKDLNIYDFNMFYFNVKQELKNYFQNKKDELDKLNNYRNTRSGFSLDPYRFERLLMKTIDDYEKLPELIDYKKLSKMYLDKMGTELYRYYDKKDLPLISQYKDGGSVLLAPNGKPSNLTPEQYELVRTPAFKEFFGDWENNPETASKVVDSNGEPLVVWHRTFADFTEFDNTKSTFKKGFVGGNSFYFSDDRYGYSNYGDKEIAVFVNLRNPTYKVNVDGEYIKSSNDGAILKYDTFGEKETSVVATKPTQIKLADGTNTTFDSNNPDIRFDEGGITISDEFSNESYDFGNVGNSIKKNNREVGQIQYDIDKENSIVTIYLLEVLEKGIGAKVINYFFNNGINTIYGDAVDSIEFWNKMGAKYDEFDEDINGYPFTISKEDFVQTKYYEDENNPDIRFNEGGETNEPIHFWGTEGGGVLVYCSTTDRYLILYRSENVLEPNTWGIISGKLDDDETNIQDAVFREAEEETGHKLVNLIPSFIFEKPNFKFHNFVSIINEEFTPELNWENSHYKWVKLNEMPDNLHFGLKLLLQKEDLPKLVKKHQMENEILIVDMNMYRYNTSVNFKNKEIPLKLNSPKNEIDFIEWAEENNIEFEQWGDTEMIDSSWGYTFEIPLFKYIEYMKTEKFYTGGELKKGIKTEMEHKNTISKIKTGNFSVKQSAKMIAKDHLKENDKYYTNLSEMESQFEEGGKVISIKSKKGDIKISLDENWYSDDTKVELVPVSELIKFREFDRKVKPKYNQDNSRDNINHLKYMFKKDGVKEPLIIEYSAQDNSVLLIEGNHRINSAIDLGMEYLPARIVLKKYGKYSPEKIKNTMKVNGIKANSSNYIPSDLKPSQVGITGTLPITYAEGGIIEGKLHSECDDDGCGVKFQVGENGHIIEAERDEAVIVAEAFNNSEIHCIEGTLLQIASALNVIGGGKNFDDGAKIIGNKKTNELLKSKKQEKDTDVDSIITPSSIIINRKSMTNTKKYRVTGTAKQIASSINSIDENGVVIEEGAKIEQIN